MDSDASLQAVQSQRWESNPQPPHYECGALPIEATLARQSYSNIIPIFVVATFNYRAFSLQFIEKPICQEVKGDHNATTSEALVSIAQR